MPYGGINPAMAAGAGRNVPGALAPGGAVNPFEAINTIANTQRTLQEVQGKQQELNARNTAAQIMSLGGSLGESISLLNSTPGLAPYIPQIYQGMADIQQMQANTQLRQAQTGQVGQQVVQTGMGFVYHGITSLNGGATAAENQAQFENLVRMGGATITDPTQLRQFLAATGSLRKYFGDSGWTGDGLTNRVYATLLPTVSPEVAQAYKTGQFVPAHQPLGTPAVSPTAGAPTGTPMSPGPASTQGPQSPIGATGQLVPPPPSGGGGAGQPTNLVPGGAAQPAAQPAVQPARGGLDDPNRAGNPSYLGTPLAPNYANLPDRMQPVGNIAKDSSGEFTGMPYGSQAAAADQEYNTSGRVTYAQATQSEQQLAGIANTFNTMQSGGAFTQPGPLGGLRSTLVRTEQMLANITGYKGELPYMPEDFTAANAARDVQNQTQAFANNLVRTLLPGQVHAASTLADTVNVVPGTEDSWLGGQTVLASLNAAVHRVSDFRQFQMQWMQDQRNRGNNTPNLVNSLEAFNQQFPPAQYQRRALENLGMTPNMTMDQIFKWENSHALNPTQGDAIIHNNFDTKTGKLKPDSMWGRMLGVEGSEPGRTQAQ